MTDIEPRTALLPARGGIAWRRVTPALALGFGLIALPCVFWILASWPGNLTEDSLATITQIREGRYDDAVPVPYTLYVQVITFGGRFIPGVMFVQCALVAAALYVLARSLGAKPKAAIGIAAVMMATPIGGLFACMAWKDVPFAALILIGLAVLLPVSGGVTRGRWIAGVSLLALGSSMRHNGWPLLLALGIATIALAALPSLRKVGLVAFGLGSVAAAILGVGLHGVTALATNATPIPAVFRDLPALGDLAYAATVYPDDSPAGLVPFVDTFSTGESRAAAATCSSINGLFFYSGFDKRAAGQDSSQTYRLLWELAKANPKLVLYLHLCRSAAYLPPPLSTGPSYMVWLTPGVLANDLGVDTQPALPALHEVARSWFDLWAKWAGFVAWAGLWGLLGTVALVLLFAYRLIGAKVLVAYLSVIWLGLSTVAIWALGQDIRYAYIPLLVSQVACVLALMVVGGRLVETRRQPESRTEPETFAGR